MSLATRLDVETVRLKFLLERNDSGAWGTDPDHTRGTVVLRSTDQTVDGTWKIYDPAIRLLSEDEARGTTLHLGDLVVTKSSGSAKHIGKTTLVNKAVADMRASFGNFMQRLRCKEGVDARFIWYLLNHEIVRRQFDELSTTSTGLSNLTGTTIGEVEVPMVGALEQRAIADFLDRETARIDTLIEEQQRLIDLLRERRQSEIDVSFEPDERWTRTSLKHCLDGVDQGVSPQAEAGLADTPGSWGVLKSGCANRGVFRQEEHKRLADDFAVNTALAISDGDLIVSRASGSPDLVGSAAIVGKIDYNLILSDKLFRLRPSLSTSSVYLYWFLNSRHYRIQVRRAISGADGLANNLPLSALRNFEMAVPPLNEQRRVAASLDEKISAIDAVAVEAEKFIELVQERRAALITAAVTGQIDVGDEVA